MEDKVDAGDRSGATSAMSSTSMSSRSNPYNARKQLVAVDILAAYDRFKELVPSLKKELKTSNILSV